MGKIVFIYLTQNNRMATPELSATSSESNLIVPVRIFYSRPITTKLDIFYASDSKNKYHTGVFANQKACRHCKFFLCNVENDPCGCFEWCRICIMETRFQGKACNNCGQIIRRCFGRANFNLTTVEGEQLKVFEPFNRESAHGFLN